MRLETFQSETVLKILKKGHVYRAKPSLSFKKEYGALIDILGLRCKCPIFTVVKGRKQNTAGRVSGACRLSLNVPDDQIKYTEFSVWADFMYGLKFAKGNDYRKVSVNSYSEVSQEKHLRLIDILKEQKPVKEYEFPQAIIEKIDPAWLVSYKRMPNSNGFIDKVEKIANIFRK